MGRVKSSGGTAGGPPGIIDGVSDAHDFVQLSVSASITTVKIDANGLAGGSKFTDLCTIAFDDSTTACSTPCSPTATSS